MSRRTPPKASSPRTRITGRKAFSLPSSYVNSTTRSLAFDAAGNGPRTAGWTATSGGPNTTLLGALDTLRRRSRDAVRQNGYAEKAVSSLVTNVIGTGIRPLTPYPELQELFEDWTDEADSRGQLDFYGLQALAFRSMLEGGDSFVRMRARLPGDVETVPLQLQVIEAEHVPATKNIAAPNGNPIVGGVERNLLDAPTAYWMYRCHPQDRIATVNGTDLIEVRVPAEDVCHVMIPRRPGEARGEPALTRALIKLRDVDLWDDATLVSHKTKTQRGGFIKTPGGEDDGAVVADIFGDGQPDKIMIDEFLPGTFPVLPPGFEVQYIDPAEAGTSYEPFMRQQLSAIAVSMGLTYEQLSQDWRGANDRTYRASMLEFSRLIDSWQHHVVVFQMCRPIWRRFVDAAILSGAWTPPQGVAPRSVYKCVWMPPARGYIHPVQEITAFTAAMQAGILPRAVAAQQLGSSVEEIDLQNARDKARADKLGLRYSAYVYADQPGVVPTPISAAQTEVEKQVEADVQDQVDKWVGDQKD